MMDVISFVSSIVPFIVVISVVIMVHELGHYWVGRMFNAAAESFAIGFGNPIFEVRDKRGTRWRLNWLPFGGFVKFVGELQAPTDTREPRPEDGKGSHHADAMISAGGAPIPIETHDKEKKAKKDEPEAELVGKPYTEIKPLQRMAISLGGPFANFIFAIAVFAGIGMFLGVSQAKEVSILEVNAGSPAEAAGFKPGDIVVEAGGRKVTMPNDVERATMLNSGEEVRYLINRAGREMEIIATPKQVSTYDEQLKMRESVGRIGIALGSRDVERRRLNPVEAVGYGVAATGDAISATLNVMRRLVTGKEGLDKLSGPVGIANISDKITDLHLKQQGVPLVEKFAGLALSLIQLMALLSIGVGFFNLLPFPILDGGAVVMCVAEAISGREVPEKLQKVGLAIGFACLACFALVITWADIGKLLAGVP
jgi:regulator of sigma E protease